jgi:hypothetical protein
LILVVKPIYNIYAIEKHFEFIGTVYRF